MNAIEAMAGIADGRKILLVQSDLSVLDDFFKRFIRPSPKGWEWVFGSAFNH